MNSERLLEALSKPSTIARDPSSSEADRRKAKKEAVLAELEAAHFLMYARRAMLQAKKDKNDEVQSDEEKELLIPRIDTLESYNISNLETYIDRFIISDRRETKFYSLEDRAKSAKTKSFSMPVIPLDLARIRTNTDSGLSGFRQRIEALESIGDKSTLESLLDAAHNISVTAPESARQFLDTLKMIPNEGQVTYAEVVSSLFRDQTDPMSGGNPLIWRLKGIEGQAAHNLTGFTKDKRLNRLYSGEQHRDSDYSLIRDFSFDNLRKRDFNRRLISSRFNSTFEKTIFNEEINNLQGIEQPNSKDNAIFFGELQSLYIKLGARATGEWLEQARSVFGENWNKGRDFAVKSGRTYVSYRTDLGWDLDQFAEDYGKLGDDLFELAEFSDKFAGLGGERRRKLARSLIDSVSGKEIKELTANALHKEQVALVGERLPEEATPSEMIAVIKKTAELYAHCNQNRVSGRFVTSRLGRIQCARSLDDYLGAIGELAKQTARYTDFANEQIKDPNMNLGFNDLSSQATLDLYETFLGKGFDQFKRDFMATGTEFQRLYEIRDKYGKFLDEEKLRAMLNYVAKQKSRDLIKDLIVTKTPDSLTELAINRLGKNGGKRELVKTLSELNKIYSFLTGLDPIVLSKLENSLFPEEVVAEKNEKQGFFGRLFIRKRNDPPYEVPKIMNRKIGIEGILDETLLRAPSDCTSDEIIQAFNGVKRALYSTITHGIEVPRELEEMISNVAVAYHRNTGTFGGVNIKPALEFIVQNYLQLGAEKSFQSIRGLEPNVKLRKRLQEKGIDVEAFEKGIERTYQVSTDEHSLARIRERIDSEIEQVWDRLKLLYTPKKDEGELDEEALKKREQLKLQIEELKQGSLREQLDNAEKFVSKYEFSDETKSLKPEIKGHIQSARSMTGSIKEMQAEARFYVSNDPLESLHMGQFFGSCLSLSKNHLGINGWASVVQTMDSNKNVIYAKSEDGAYLGRNRTVLTDRGVLCTRFYQNKNMNLNDAWIKYLTDFADHTGQEVMIPTNFTPDSMAKLLEGKTIREHRSVRIEPAYFNAFYGDGLNTQNTLKGDIQVDAEVYVIKPVRIQSN